MLSKVWKKIGLIILIIACLFNIIVKLVNKVSFNKTISTATSEIQQTEHNK